MNCPSCKKRSLKPAKLEYGLPGYTCSHCHGFLLDVLTYRSWLESQPKEGEAKKLTPQSVEDTASAILCPKCSKIMTKYRISGEVENKLDLCSSCGELWFDAGEWNLLNQLDLSSKIPQILSEPWQKVIRSDSLEQAIEKKFEAMFGKTDYAKIREFREWMAGHQKCVQLQDYLNRANRSR